MPKKVYKGIPKSNLPKGNYTDYAMSRLNNDDDPAVRRLTKGLISRKRTRVTNTHTASDLKKYEKIKKQVFGLK